MRRITVLLALVLAVTLTACGGSPAPTPSSESNAVTPPTAQADAANPQPTQPSQAAADTVALVNGQPITRAAYERALERARYYSATPDDSTLPAQTLEVLIEQMLITQAAAQLNVTVTDAEVQAEIDALKATAQSEQEWQAWLEANVFTESEIVEATRENLLTNRVREAVIAQSASQASGATVQQVHARHILVGSEAEARAILEQLQAGGDFVALAATYSRDSLTKDSGGDLGFFVRDDLTTPELADLAFSLQPGQIGGPLQTMLGYHVVQTLEFADTPALETVQGTALEARFADWLTQQRTAATIERFIE